MKQLCVIIGIAAATTLNAADDKPAADKAACATCACAATDAPKSDTEKAPYGQIDTNALKALIAAKAPCVLLDARSGKYDDGQRIPGARQLAPDADEASISKLIASKDTLVITYCSNLKCPASKLLAERLASLGYKNILKYPEGIAAWIAAGNTVEKAK